MEEDVVEREGEARHNDHLVCYKYTSSEKTYLKLKGESDFVILQVPTINECQEKEDIEHIKKEREKVGEGEREGEREREREREEEGEKEKRETEAHTHLLVPNPQKCEGHDYLGGGNSGLVQGRLDQWQVRKGDTGEPKEHIDSEPQISPERPAVPWPSQASLPSITSK